MLDLLEEFRGIVSALEEAGVPFAVCGGLAVAVHVRARATVDIDLLVPPEAVTRAAEVARSRGYRIEAGPLRFRSGDGVIHRFSKPDPETGDRLGLDLLEVTTALQPVWEDRERVGWEFGSLPVVSRRGLASMKRLRGSDLDRDDLRRLEEEGGGGGG